MSRVNKCPDNYITKIKPDLYHVSLTQGKIALVDKKGYDKIKSYLWLFNTSSGYAERMVHNNGKSKRVFMHRFLLNTPKNKITDHINTNRLDNRFSNLRICTRQENVCNMRNCQGGTSKYKGVIWHKAANSWVAQIQARKKRIHLGCFKNEIEAAIAYNEAALKYHGEFARLNDIDHEHAPALAAWVSIIDRK